MKYCKNCTHAIFDQLWGSYKCGIKQTSVDTHFTVDCPDYEEGNPTISKDVPEGYGEDE